MGLHRPLPLHDVQPVHGVPVDLVPRGRPHLRNCIAVEEHALFDRVIKALLKEDSSGDLKGRHTELIQHVSEDRLFLLHRLSFGQ